jgi:hypothetical protein
MEELDLHWTEEDADLGIHSDGVFCENMGEITARISEVKDTVKKINLNNQLSLTEVPAVLGSCLLLEELNISHTKLKEIPDFLFELPRLRSLSFCCNALWQFPKSISNAQKLERLHVRINKGWDFPKEICSLENLKILTVDLYSSSDLPHNMGEMRNLEELILVAKYDEGAVPSLPKSFKGHDALKKLMVHDPFHKTRKDFDLDSAAHILSSCGALETLKLSGVAVGKGHRALSSLKNLKELELRHLIVEGDENIFKSVSSLHNLEKLDVWGSEFKINEIPDIFAGLKELLSFSFAGNIVLELPPSVYSLDKLVSLEIGSTGISAIDEKIGNLKTLERLQLYDNILERLPASVFSLPRLKILNIEENVFNPREIAAIKETLKALAAKGQKVEFLFDGQGHRQMVKRLRALRNVDRMDTAVYGKYCYNAALENPYSIKYIDKDKLKNTKFYFDACTAAVKKNCFALENVDMETLGKQHYFNVCMEASCSHEIGNAFNLIRQDALTDSEYIQVCISAALHNRSNAFLEYFNNEAFSKRFSREIYERLCWAAVLHYPPVISKMVNPTKELHDLAVKLAKK